MLPQCITQGYIFITWKCHQEEILKQGTQREKSVISEWMLGTMVIRGQTLGKMVTSDQTLETMVIQD